jgi:NAD(P)H-flavin reductase
MWQAIAGAGGGGGLMSSNVVRVAAVAFLVAFAVSMAARFSGSISQGFSNFFKTLNGRFEALVERVKPVEEGVPMPFAEGNEGWGVCTLRSRKRLGKTNFIQYEFDLPEPDYVLPLELGQQVSLCCLDNENNVARADFFPFHPTAQSKPGSFSVLVPNKSPEDTVVLMGLEAANFARVVKKELKIGDELALKPGDTRLTYRGQYLPVTDIVYIACGNGVVPVLEQARAVLPRGSSSVDAVSVVWINEETKDFDVLAEILEKEYFKYSDKLAVSCIVDSPRRRDWSDNTEINGAVPDFKQGTMAVLAGPTDLMEKAFYYLEDRGYPRDTICVL